MRARVAVPAIEEQAVGEVGERVPEVPDLEVDQRRHLVLLHDAVHEPRVAHAHGRRVVGARGEVLGEPFERGELAGRLLGLHHVEHGVAPVAQHAAQPVVAVAERVDPIDVGGVQFGETVVERFPDRAP